MSNEPDTDRYVYHAERLWEAARAFMAAGYEGRPDEWVYLVRDLISQAKREADVPRAAGGR